MLAPALRDAYDLSLFRVGHRARQRLDRYDAHAAAVGPPGRQGRRAARAGGRARRLWCGTDRRRSRGQTSRSSSCCSRLAGAAGASVNSASGRAVMQWFPASERGLALGRAPDRDPARGLGRGRSRCRPSGCTRLSSSWPRSASPARSSVTAVIREREAAEDVLEPRRAADDAARRAALVAVRRQQPLRRRADRGDGLRRPLPARRARLLSGRGGGRARGNPGARDCASYRDRPLVGRDRLAAGAAQDRRAGEQRHAGGLRGRGPRCAVRRCSCPPSCWPAALRCPGTGSPSRRRPSSPAAAEAARRSACSRRRCRLAGALVPPAFAALVAATSWRVGFALAAVFPLVGVQLLRPLRSVRA